MKISFVIPACNEEKRIKKTLSRIKQFKGADEIIVVSNGVDRTPEIVREFKKKDSRVKLLDFDAPLGKGGAVIEGLKKARFNVVIYDADGSTPLEEIEAMKEKLKQGFDFIIGSRNLPESRVERSFAREVNSRFFNSLARFLLKIPYRDTQCGFKAFNNKTAKILARETTYKGWTWDLDALMIAKKNKLKVAEIPIKWTHEKTDNWRGFKKLQLLRMLEELFKMSLEAKN